MTWIHTHSGKALDLFDPQPSQVCVEDVAHALARICRYTGHSHHHYSVAEHSVHCSRVVSGGATLGDGRALSRQALLHDATEAYVSDLAAPIKRLCPDYQAIEQRVWLAVAEHFGISPTLRREVKLADLRMLATEAPQLLSWPPPRDWALPAAAVPYDLTIECWSVDLAESRFLRAYESLS
jgi:hypothetical protein